MPDFTACDHGSMTLITPVSTEAREWTDAHIDGDTPWFGRGFAVENRYASGIVEGILGDGLTVA